MSVHHCLSVSIFLSVHHFMFVPILLRVHMFLFVHMWCVRSYFVRSSVWSFIICVRSCYFVRSSFPFVHILCSLICCLFVHIFFVRSSYVFVDMCCSFISYMSVQRLCSVICVQPSWLCVHLFARSFVCSFICVLFLDMSVFVRAILFAHHFRSFIFYVR